MRVTIIADPVLEYLNKCEASGRGDGQAATWLTEVASCMTKQNEFIIRWISLSRKRKTRAEQSIGPHHFVELPQFSASVDSRFGYAYSKQQLLREINKEETSIVHVWGSERPYPSVLNKIRVPSLFSMNGVLSALESVGALPPGKYWQRQAQLEKRWLPHAQLITTESSWARERLQPAIAKSKCGIIVYGVNSSFYSMKWSPDSSNPNIICVGTVSKGKGSDQLIDAVESLTQRRFTLHMVGDGPLLKKLQSRNTPGVIWHGQVGWRKLQSLLAQSWCLVHPTLADSNPNAVKEARVVGLPIITTKNGGQAEYLINQGNSIILDHLTVQSLAQAIEFYTQDYDACKKAGSHGHNDDRDRFCTKNTVEAFYQSYRMLTQGSGGK